MIKKVCLYMGIIILALSIQGCGSNDKSDGSASLGGESSMSILLEGIVKLDRTRGCQKYFVVHAVDGNGNAIPGLKVDANVIVRAKASGNASGMIHTTSPITFTDSNYNFNGSNIIFGDDLIVLPSSNNYHPSYLGDWKIYKTENSTLTLRDSAYNLETTDNLNYIVGNASVYVPGYGNAVAHVENRDNNGTITTNADGYAYFDLLYDLALIGHSYVVGAHTTDGYRIGASVISVLPNCSVSVDSNTSN